MDGKEKLIEKAKDLGESKSEQLKRLTLQKAKADKILLIKGAIFDLLEVEAKIKGQFDQVIAAKEDKFKELNVLRKNLRIA